MKEEEEAIERFKRKIERADKDILKFSDVYTTLDIHNLRLLLNLVEKQQEKIKELTAFYNDFESGKITNYPIFKQRYISKDKIKQIINKYVNIEEHIKYTNQELFGEDLKNMIIELLEEKNNE